MLAFVNDVIAKGNDMPSEPGPPSGFWGYDSAA
jgi:hypothetical protein